MAEAQCEETTSDIKVNGKVVLSDVPTTVATHEEAGMVLTTISTTLVTVTLTSDQWDAMPHGEMMIWPKWDNEEV